MKSPIKGFTYFLFFIPFSINPLFRRAFLLVIEKIFSAMDCKGNPMAELFYHLSIDFLLVIQIIGFQNESCILEPIIFCITNEIKHVPKSKC